MGLFDSVMVPCPNCGKPVEFQSKADECYMHTYTLADAPAEILTDIMNCPEYCMSCGQWLVLIDPRYPPGEKPKPELSAAKVKAPANPRTHFQGFRWWPDDTLFDYSHLEQPPTSAAHQGARDESALQAPIGAAQEPEEKR